MSCRAPTRVGKAIFVSASRSRLLETRTEKRIRKPGQGARPFRPILNVEASSPCVVLMNSGVRLSASWRAKPSSDPSAVHQDPFISTTPATLPLLHPPLTIMASLSNDSNHIASVYLAPQIRRIQHLLIASGALAILAFAMSMVLFSGFLSFFITPAAAGASLVLDATLLALTHQEQQRARTSAGRDSESGSPQSTGANQTAHRRSRQYPCAIRIPSLVVAFGLTCLWLTAIGFNLYFLSRVEALELYNWNYPTARIAGPILEVVFIVGQVGVLVTYIVLGVKERRRLSGYREADSTLR